MFTISNLFTLLCLSVFKDIKKESIKNNFNTQMYSQELRLPHYDRKVLKEGN